MSNTLKYVLSPHFIFGHPSTITNSLDDFGLISTTSLSQSVSFDYGLISYYIYKQNPLLRRGPLTNKINYVPIKPPKETPRGSDHTQDLNNEEDRDCLYTDTLLHITSQINHSRPLLSWAIWDNFEITLLQN
ncbi:hypothetical protein L1987_56274 [Smallanthus sonchifolius]|uniref:Uncharacterized protein n=1 Tax=Smallanthus sonchifolius TaxID=185202 RepID=A0ACB9ECY1_9ASTR|nr:hypothetical protein L1987_56274 [Smallanthus sonchifolius]